MSNETLSLIRRHRSIRRFAPTPVPPDDIRRAVEAGQAASTSSAVQSYCLLQVTDPDERRRLAELSGGQPHVADCGATFVVCGDTRRHRLICERAGRPYETSFEAFLVAIVDATLFAQNLALALESMGYGICYIGGLRNDLPSVDGLLEIPEGVYPLYGLCAGVPAETPSARPRLSVDSVLFADRYPDDRSLLDLVDDYDSRYEAWLRQRGASVRGWSEVMTGKFSEPRRTEIARYYRGKGASTE